MNDNIPLAVAYYINGSNFRVSAERLMEGLDLDSSGRPTKLTAVPLYFLASHAAELFLKAALLKRGFAEGGPEKTRLSAQLGCVAERNSRQRCTRI